MGKIILPNAARFSHDCIMENPLEDCNFEYGTFAQVEREPTTFSMENLYEALDKLRPYLDHHYGRLHIVCTPFPLKKERLEYQQRSWRERLFERPWRPWVRAKLVKIVTETTRFAFRCGDTIIAGQEYYNELMASIPKGVDDTAGFGSIPSSLGCFENWFCNGVT